MPFPKFTDMTLTGIFKGDPELPLSKSREKSESPLQDLASRRPSLSRITQRYPFSEKYRNIA